MTQVFIEKLEKYGLGCCAKGMADYADRLLSVNEHMNLTRITDPEEMAVKHFIDSAHPDILSLIPEGASVVDVGTGGGFPGVPIKLARGDIDMTFMESVGKKLDFVRSACEELGIDGRFICVRAEEADELRESFDVSVSRAVASLPMLLELCSPLVRTGGRVIAYKGLNAQEEIDAAGGAAKRLGLALAEKRDIDIEGARHCVLVYKKLSPTPKGYPRRYAQIKKSPLR